MLRRGSWFVYFRFILSTVTVRHCQGVHIKPRSAPCEEPKAVAGDFWPEVCVTEMAIETAFGAAWFRSQFLSFDSVWRFQIMSAWH